VELSTVLSKYKPDDIKNSSAATTWINSIKNSDEFNKMDPSNKEVLEKRVFPWTEIRGKLAESSEHKEKDLALILDKFIKEPHIESQLSISSKETYSDLKEKLGKLKEYQASENYKKLSSEQRTAFESLVKDLGKKIDEKKSEYDKESTSDPKKPFFKTPGGIILIVAILLVVVAGIAYLIKINSSSDEAAETESE